MAKRTLGRIVVGFTSNPFAYLALEPDGALFSEREAAGEAFRGFEPVEMGS